MTCVDQAMACMDLPMACVDQALAWVDQAMACVDQSMACTDQSKACEDQVMACVDQTIAFGSTLLKLTAALRPYSPLFCVGCYIHYFLPSSIVLTLKAKISVDYEFSSFVYLFV